VTSSSAVTGSTSLDDAAALLERVATDVFATMVGSALAARPVISTGTTSQPQISATVAFGGSWCGFVSILTSHDAARRITACLLQADVTDVDHQVRDAIGELANVIAGAFRMRMASGANSWTITIPVVTTGASLSIQPPAGAFHTVSHMAFHHLTFDVHLVVMSRSERVP
jgi:chemotaxis protein CheX